MVDDDEQAGTSPPHPARLCDASSPAWSGERSSGATAAWLAALDGDGDGGAPGPGDATARRDGPDPEADGDHPFAVPDGELAYYDAAAGDWQLEPARYVFRFGERSDALPLEVVIVFAPAFLLGGLVLMLSGPH